MSPHHRRRPPSCHWRDLHYRHPDQNCRRCLDPPPGAVSPLPGWLTVVTRGTQKDGNFDIRERACSRLFSRWRDLLSLAPQAPVDYALLTEEEHAFARKIDPDHRRRICTCHHWVEHALRLWRTSHPAGRPRTDGCQFITVPACQFRSTTGKQQRLCRLFSDRRELLT